MNQGHRKAAKSIDKAHALHAQNHANVGLKPLPLKEFISLWVAGHNSALRQRKRKTGYLEAEDEREILGHMIEQDEKKRQLDLSFVDQMR